MFTAMRRSWQRRVTAGLVSLGLGAMLAHTAVAASPGLNRPAVALLIAILDSGVAEEHPAFAGAVIDRRGFTDSPRGADDVYNHGTHVAGIALAAAGPGARLLNVKVCADDGRCVPEVVAAGIRWATDRGARVINLSLTGRTGVGACTAAHQAAIDHAWAHQVVVVTAAGNDGATAPVRPAGCAHVLSVAAVTDDGVRADFSNHGPWVGVAAPGVEIRSLNNVGGYGRMSGTSMAAPQVSGLAARVWASCGSASAQAVLERITGSADAIAGTGADWRHGRVNVGRAICPAP